MRKKIGALTALMLAVSMTASVLLVGCKDSSKEGDRTEEQTTVDNEAASGEDTKGSQSGDSTAPSGESGKEDKPNTETPVTDKTSGTESVTGDLPGTDQPITGGASGTTGSPVITQSPTGTGKPGGTAKPTVTVKPPVTGKPTVTTKKPTVTTKPPVTDKPSNEPAKGTSITISYTVNNQSGGKLSGSTRQTIRYGETKTTSVTAVANLGYKFTGWSDGVKTATRSAESPRQNGTVTALFEIERLELPIISLTTQNGAAITSKTDYINGTISIFNCKSEYEITSMDMEIRGRGNYTWSSQFPNGKLPYRIKLSKKQNLLGEGSGKAKVWTLIADHCDQALLRNYTTLNFARSLSGIAWNSAAQSVEVFLNGEYRGVFLLCEQNQVNEARVNINDDIEAKPADRGYLVELSGYAEEPMFYIENTKYEIKSDLSTNESLYWDQYYYISDYMEQCWNAVNSGNQAQIEKLIDIKSAVDTYIVEELFKNLDAGWDSFYFHKDKGGKLVFGPIWDFDQSGGNADEGCENYEGLRGSETNVWYKALLRTSWFKNMVNKRWNELKPQIDKIPASIITQAQAGYKSYCRNFDRWPIFGQKINRETAAIRALKSYKEHYEYYSNWMKNRIVWLNDYYNSESFSFDGKLTLSGSGTKSNPYKVTSAADFQNFTLCCLSGQTFSGKYFKQTADIDLTGLKNYAGMGSGATFAGTYNGGGHSVKVNIKGSDGNVFPYLTGTVMNVLTEGSVTNSYNAAGICRSVRSGGKLINCASYVKVTSNGGTAGGIMSSIESGACVKNCYFGGSLSAPEWGPITSWYDRTGNFSNLFYTNAISYYADSYYGEQAYSSSQLSNAASALNSAKSAAASSAGATSGDLCSWQVSSGKLIMTKQ